MTSIMSISRIPVPVRNFEVATQHRSISAKTRLERLRDEFQRKLLFEKQAKLHDFYAQNQRRETKAAAGHRLRSGEIGYGRYRNPEATADFFSEREALMSGQQNGYTSQNNFSDAPGSLGRRPPLPPYPKRSAGRDRAHLLAPINPARPNRESPKLREGQTNDSGSLAPSPNNLGNTYTHRKPNIETVEMKLAPRPPPVVSRPKVVRPYVRNRIHQVQFQDETDGQGKGQFDRTNLEKLKQVKLHQLNEEVSNGPNHSMLHPSDTQGEMESLQPKKPGVSDFQKLQMEQNQERARRLQHLNERSRTRESSPFHKENKSGRDGPKQPRKEQSRPLTEDDNENDKKQNQVRRLKQQILQYHNRQEATTEMKLDDEEEDLEDKRLKQKERELQELIWRQEEELQKLRQEKVEEEEEEKLKEIENEKRQAKFHQQKQKILEAEMLEQKMRHDSRTPHVDKTSEITSSQTATRNKPTRRTSVASLPPKQMWEPEIDPSNEETAFYLQKAISEGKLGADEVKLVPCQVCSRSFASDRIAKHEKICSKESKKTRKVFDHVAMRYRGTDFENHVKRRESISEESVNEEQKSHWRTKHQNLIDTMKYAKKVAKVENEGGNLSRLPPPPVTLNPDYVQCPHCQRRFNRKAADRHIPWCKDSKSRQPLKPKGHRQ